MSVDSSGLLKKAVRLEYFTLGLNVTGAGAALAAGIIAGSIALIGFGLDRIIAGAVVGLLVVHLRAELSDGQRAGERSTIDRRPLFAVGITFFLLALYLVNESGSKLYYKEKPAESLIGLALAALLMISMAVLAIMKFRTAKALNRRSLRADAVDTTAAAFLSVVLFLGLGLNSWLGWWWADPVAALLMLPWLAREGIEGLRGDG